MTDASLPPLPLLLSGHAGADAARHRAIWAYDGRLARVARTTRERAIGQMRLAWWNDVMEDDAGLKGQGAPVVDALRATGRGGGLFRALARQDSAPDWRTAAGQVWALWDLAGHVEDAALADAALALARTQLPLVADARWTSAWRPLRIAFTLARQDVLAGRGAPRGMPRGLALRLLRIALVGR